MQRLRLRYGPRKGWVYLRELRGDDEESIAGTDTWSAIALVDRLLVAVPGSAIGPGGAIELGAADRDRLLAAIMRRELGERVTATIVCSACRAQLDLDFALGDLIADLDARATEVGDESVRLPSGHDELAAAASDDPLGVLVRACTPDDDAGVAAISAALEARAPIVDLELEAACADCGRVTPVRFSIQHYLLGAVIGEARRRATEVHQLARGYGWSLAEILTLSRKRRRDYVALCERGRA